ncbi:uncharacterized protein LOC125651504 isoform X2 [Ostrea edulis]|uniref:uncharacterized protein LOC125651504 isoform X2 n=1 Tax=Ostrea edulis TaxID=37623 RepID=UPI0020961106|nr:uncharacterized protein LOC125651504 isoform X2 [Ostrea edulis]
MISTDRVSTDIRQTRTVSGMDVSNKSAIDTHAVKRKISCARKTTREFNNKITDVNLDNDLSCLPCKVCSSQLKKEADALSEQIDRLQSFFKDGSPLFFKCSCHPTWSGDMENGAEECSFHWRNVRKCISSTRKTMRDYSDRIDDGRIRGKDVGPCQTCKNGLVKECKGLEEEIETMREHLMRVDVDVDKEICSCMYGTDGCSVNLRPQKQKGRKVSECSDSGYLSTGSKVLSSIGRNREGIESEDQAALPFPLQALSLVEEGNRTSTTENGSSEVLDLDAIKPSKEEPQKGQYVSIDVSLGTGVGVQEENSSTA